MTIEIPAVLLTTLAAVATMLGGFVLALLVAHLADFVTFLWRCWRAFGCIPWKKGHEVRFLLNCLLGGHLAMTHKETGATARWPGYEPTFNRDGVEIDG